MSHKKIGGTRRRRSQASSVRKQLEISAVRRILPPLAKDLWPLARQTQRRWTAWLGPTNSGKTYMALRHLREVGGSYLAPLRLLAQEVHEIFEAQGVPTSLHTGEERILRENSEHTAATVEMVETTLVSGCVVIDEIQMLGDRERGHAWVRALLGAPAAEVLLCGTPQVEWALRQLAEYAGVPIEIHALERKTPIEVAREPVPLASVPDGSIVVAFSRTDVLILARTLRDRGRSVSTIYGAMPPELRRAESRRFRSGEATVMIATDAVGMGLNIPAETVIFSTATKFDGISERILTPQEVLQIGGRAGRYGLHQRGIVAGMDHKTHNIIRRQFNGEISPLAGPFPFMPDISIVRSASEVLGTDNLGTLLASLHGSILADAHMRSGIGPEVRQRAGKLEILVHSLSFSERYLLLFAPVNRSTELDFWRWIGTVGRSGMRVPSPRMRPVLSRGEGEEFLALLSLYKWLSLRLPERFPEIGPATEHYSVALEQTRIIIEREGRARRGRKMKTGSPIGR